MSPGLSHLIKLLLNIVFLSYVQDYAADQLLVVYDPMFKYGQNFYLALTEEAKERLLNVSENFY